MLANRRVYWIIGLGSMSNPLRFIILSIPLILVSCSSDNLPTSQSAFSQPSMTNLKLIDKLDGDFIFIRAIDSNSNSVFVVDTGECKVHKINIDETTKSVGRKGGGPGEFNKLANIGVNDDFVAVLDMFGQVTCYDGQLNFINTFKIGYSSIFLAVDSKNNIYIPRFDRYDEILINKFNSNGILLNTLIVKKEEDEPMIWSPFNLKVDQEGFIITASMFNNLIKIYDESGKQVISFHEPKLPELSIDKFTVKPTQFYFRDIFLIEGMHHEKLIGVLLGDILESNKNREIFIYSYTGKRVWHGLLPEESRWVTSIGQKVLLATDEEKTSCFKYEFMDGIK